MLQELPSEGPIIRQEESRCGKDLTYHELMPHARCCTGMTVIGLVKLSAVRGNSFIAFLTTAL